jgi:urease accessory protein UreE
MVLMAHLFKPLPVAHEIHTSGALPERAREYSRDRVTLGWEERLKARGRCRSDAGFEFGTALPRGTVLGDGDGFVFDDHQMVVLVAAREEPVFVVQPRTTSEWGQYAYYIGNSHQPLMVAADGLVCPDVPGMEQVLTYHRIAYSRAMRAFTPVGRVPHHQHRP